MEGKSLSTPVPATGQTRINLTASRNPEVKGIGIELALMRDYAAYLRNIISMLKQVRDLQQGVRHV